MELREQLREDLKTAMRDKDAIRLSTIRMLLSEIQKVETSKGSKTVDSAGIQTIIIKVIKQRKESETQFRKADRAELADKEKAEAVILQQYLPEPLDIEEIESAIDNAIAEINASSMQDMGKLMTKLKPKLQGRADMGQVSRLIKEKLQA